MLSEASQDTRYLIIVCKSLQGRRVRVIDGCPRALTDISFRALVRPQRFEMCFERPSHGDPIGPEFRNLKVIQRPLGL